MAGSGAPRTVIMGAGVIGVTNAYYLAKEGHQVTVIDRQPVAAAETSFANAGLVAPGHALTWNLILVPSAIAPTSASGTGTLRRRWEICWCCTTPVRMAPPCHRTTTRAR